MKYTTDCTLKTAAATTTRARGATEAIRPAIEGVDSVNEGLVFNVIREPWRMYDPAMDVHIYALTIPK